MNKFIIATTAIGIALLSSNSMAKHRQYQDNNFEDSAKVVKVRPIYETIRVHKPEERCWKTDSHRRTQSNDSYTGTILGAIVGGVVGNQFGQGRGKTVMTVAGSVLGASVGNEITRANHSDYDDSPSYECETVDHYEEQQEIVGYRVKYRYKGRTYRTRTKSHPGKRLPVRVDVRPIRF